MAAHLRRLGWSQAELARRIDKNPTYLCRVLSGQVTSRVVWDLAWEAVTVAMATSIGKPGAVSATSDENTRCASEAVAAAPARDPGGVSDCPNGAGEGL